MVNKTKKNTNVATEDKSVAETVGTTETTTVVANETKAENAEIANVQENVAISENKSHYGEEKKNFVLMVALLALIIVSIVLYCRNNKLAEHVAVLEQQVSKVENTVSQNVDNNRKIYIFNMEEAVNSTGVKDANLKFEEDINELDAQVKDAQATIKSIKDEAVKAKMLNLTLKPLQMKRDDLLEAYSKSMQESLIQINEALAEYATENNVPTIFINKSVAVNTNYVIDVTPEVIAKIKAKQQPK